MSSDAIGGAVAFGHRGTPPGSEDGPPENWPFVSKDNALSRSMPFIGGIILVTTFQLVPVVLKSKSVTSFLEQGGIIALLMVFALIGLTVFILSRRLALTIDRNGIVYSCAAKTWQYAWPDIERVVETKNAVRLVLKGRTDAQNQYNILPANLGLKKSQLGALVAYGVATCASSSKMQTFAQGDDLKQVRSSSIIALNGIMGFSFLMVLFLLASTSFGKAYDASRLQKSGIRARADVTRLFTGSCGKNGCSIFADYTFVARDPESGEDTTYTDTARIGSEHRPSDASLLEIKATSAMPIVYDQREPKFSRDNLRDHIFAPNPWRRALSDFGVMGGTLTLIWGIIWGAIFVPMTRSFRAA